MTQGLERILRNICCGSHYIRVRPKVPVLDDPGNNISFIVVNLKGRSTIDCPLYMVSALLKELNLHRDDNLTEIVIPLQMNSYWGSSEDCKSVDTAFKQVFESGNGYVLNTANINNTTLYGLPGLLLDSEYQPLMMVTIEVHLGEDMHFGDYKVTIPPEVYFNKDKISQGIIKKLVPYFLESAFRTDFATNLTDKDFHPVIVFKPIDNYVTLHNSALEAVAGNTSPNEILRNNIETLKYSLNHVF